MKNPTFREGGFCASDTKICGSASRSSPWRRISPTTPTTTNHGPSESRGPNLNLLPTGSCPGHERRAIASLIIATCGAFGRDEAFHQALRIGEILLASARSTIRLRLGKMERARERWRAVARAAARAPMLFECLPHRPPVLRGRLHDDIVHLVLDQPIGQAA